MINSQTFIFFFFVKAASIKCIEHFILSCNLKIIDYDIVIFLFHSLDNLRMIGLDIYRVSIMVVVVVNSNIVVTYISSFYIKH